MSEYHPSQDHDLIDGLFQEAGGKIYRLVGVLYGGDDWYYVMIPAGKGPYSSRDQRLLSCVGDIEQHGFEMVA